MSETRLAAAEVRRIWADRSIPLRDAARQLGVSADALRRRAQAMGLPDRRASAVAADAIRAAWADLSVTDAELAARLGIARSSLWRNAKALGLPPRPRKQHSVKDRALFAAMWAEGVSLAEMGRVFAVHPMTVSATAKAFGLPPRRSGGPQRALRADQFGAALADRILARRLARVADETQAALRLSEMVDRIVSPRGCAA